MEIMSYISTERGWPVRTASHIIIYILLLASSCFYDISFLHSMFLHDDNIQNVPNDEEFPHSRRVPVRMIRTHPKAANETKNSDIRIKASPQRTCFHTICCMMMMMIIFIYTYDVYTEKLTREEKHNTESRAQPSLSLTYYKSSVYFAIFNQSFDRLVCS